MRAGAVVFIAMGLICGSVVGAELDAQQLTFFETKIRPVLVEHCYRCHSAQAEKVRGGLLLDTRAGIRKGGESGPAVVPKDIDASLLVSALRHESFEMPPDRKLSDEVIGNVEAWIRLGAPDPRDGEVKSTGSSIDIEAGKAFWSFQPVANPKVPSVRNGAWPRSDIDRFILSQLEGAGLQPLADASPTTLIRRVYYALIGLPPTPEEIEAFEQAASRDLQAAMGKLVDHLLESQHFGERWGRHWLDVVRFAESSGGGRTLLFPDAWRYRDFVIDAFNRDVPYDHFIKQQLAGDLLEAKDWQERRRNITATAFLVLGPTNYELQDKEVLEMDIVDEQLDTMGKALLGMTLGCARCHDHKFDPIPTRDYYGLAGILKSTKSVIHSNVSKWNEVELPMPASETAKLKAADAQLAALQKQLKPLRAELKKLGGDAGVAGKPLDPKQLIGIVVDDRDAVKQGPWSKSQSVPGYVADGYLYSGGGKASVAFAPKLPHRAKYEVRITFTPHGNRAANAHVKVVHAGGEKIVRVDQTKAGSIAPSVETLGVYDFDPQATPRVVISNEGVSTGTVIADAVMFIEQGTTPAPAAIAQRKPTPDVATRRATLTAQINDLEKQIKAIQLKSPKRPIAMAVTERDKMGDIPIAIRGVVHNPGRIVSRGFLQVASHSETPSIAKNESGRLQLAAWIASPDNPLTARMIVNRTWYWLFGEGIVRTVDNFGSTGDKPSHPELLDHLAAEFVADGWSIKRLVRRIVLSRTYQLSSGSPAASNPNPQSVDPGNRLLWRMNRQRLDAESIRDTLLAIGGNLDLTVGGSNMKAGTKSEYGYAFVSTRRSVYVPVFRNTLPPIFAAFDFADPNIQLGHRTSSTTSPQALLMMNHPFVMDQATAAAKQLLALADRNVDERIARAYRQVLGRLPSEREATLARQFLGNSREASRWALFYQTLFQSLDFRYLK